MDWKQFKNDAGEALLRLLLAFFFNFIGSAIPDWSASTFWLNMGLIFLGVLGSMYFYRTSPDPRTLWNRISFILFLLLSIFLVTPILRLSQGTIVFWALLGAFLIYILNFLLRYISVIQGVNIPSLPKVRTSIIWGAFILIITAFFLVNENGNVILQIAAMNEAALIFSVIFYLGGLLFNFISFILLIDN